MRKIAIAMLLLSSPAAAQVANGNSCYPIGKTDKGDLVYSMDCPKIPAPVSMTVSGQQVILQTGTTNVPPGVDRAPSGYSNVTPPSGYSNTSPGVTNGNTSPITNGNLPLNNTVTSGKPDTK